MIILIIEFLKQEIERYSDLIRYLGRRAIFLAYTFNCGRDVDFIYTSFSIVFGILLIVHFGF